MKNRTITWVLSVSGVLALTVIGASADDKAQKGLTLADLPEAARAALEELSGGAPIKDVEREREHGALVYEAEWTVDGADHEACVTEDGALVEIEEEVSFDTVPAAVRAAVIQHFGADAKVEVEKKTIIAYEVEAMVGGHEKSVLILPTGKVHGDTDDDDDDGPEGDD